MAMFTAPLLLAALSLPVPAQAMTPTEEQVVERGLDALYRSDYNGAERAFQDSLQKEPGNPVYSLGRAAAAWWRMENDFVMPGSPEEKPFLAAVKQAIEDAKSATDAGEKAQAYLCLGAAYGLRGRWEAAQHKWLAAYLDGRRAYHNQKRALKLDPQLYDAYLGIGAFDYYVATLSSFIRAFVFTSGVGKEQGLYELKLAAQEGHFGRVAAKLLLVGVYWTSEKKPQEAWKILEELHGLYPHSPMMDSMRLIGLFHLRDGAGLKKAARAFLESAQNGAPFFRNSDRVAGRYFLGLGEQLSGRYPQALSEYTAALKELPRQHRSKSLLLLFSGEARDLMGRRDEALADYRRSLEEPPFWGVPRYAKHLLKHPFRAGDNPLPSQHADLR